MLYYLKVKQETENWNPYARPLWEQKSV